MRRRDVLKLLGCGAIAGPREASAQTSSRMHRIGLLTATGPLTDNSRFGAPLMHDLAKRGYVEGGNVVFERRGAGDHLDRLPRLVEELVAAKVNVIVALGYPPALAAKQGSAIPVVVIGAGDPVAIGLANSLARPGGNLTGVSDVVSELTIKRIDLLREVAPRLRRVAMLWNAADPAMTLRYQASEVAAKAMGIFVQPISVRQTSDFDQAFATMSRELPDAMLIVSESLVTGNRQRVFEFTAAHRLPAIYEWDYIVRDGGLMSYGMDVEEGMGRVAALVDRLLKGANPADLPIEQPTRFRFVINLKTAKALGVTIPPLLLARADEVIE
jgi:putative ABC transport system substrate-binding protein